MVTQSVFTSGEWFIWAMLLIGLAVYGRVDVESLANSRNGVQMESMIGKVYAMFAINVGIALALVLYPVVMIILKVHWFFITANTFYTLTIGLVALLLVRSIAERVHKIKIRLDEEKGKNKRINFPEENWYLGYKAMVWGWVTLAIALIITTQITIGKLTMPLYSDVLIWFGVVGYMAGYYAITMYAVKKIESTLKPEVNEENR